MVSDRIRNLLYSIPEEPTGAVECDETQPITLTTATPNIDTLAVKMTQFVTAELGRRAAPFTWWGSPSHATGLLEENWQLQSEVHALRRSLVDIQARLSQLEDAVPSFKLVVLRQVTRDEAKSEIRQLFRSAETLDYEDIVEKLQIDLELVVDICQELIEAGEIGPDAGIHQPG